PATTATIILPAAAASLPRGSSIAPPPSCSPRRPVLWHCDGVRAGAGGGEFSLHQRARGAAGQDPATRAETAARRAAVGRHEGDCGFDQGPAAKAEPGQRQQQPLVSGRTAPPGDPAV